MVSLDRVRVALRVLALCACASPLLAATRHVPAGGDLQAALDAALPGDVILLEPGATFTGNFRLPPKQGHVYITLRSDGTARELPGSGERMSPAYASRLAKLRSANSAPALTAMPGAHHWRVELLEFQATAGGVGDIIALGAGGSQTDVAQMPYALIIDRVYVHGDPTVGQKRGIALNSGATQILNSHIADIKAVGIDSQAIAGWNGTGPYLIENNHLEAAGENLLFGGADPAIWNLVPSDITIRRNLMTKPLQWRQERWQVKNAFELKSARRVLVEGNVFEHVWVAAQNGYAILFTPRNQNGGAPWSQVEDVTFQYNVIRHAGGAINLAGFDDLRPSAQTRRVRIAHNLVYDIDRTRWGGSGHFLMIGHAPASVTVEHNTVWHSGNALNAHGRSAGMPSPIEGFVFRHNLMKHNRYGVIGDGLGIGLATLDVYFPGARFERNVLAGGRASLYPPGNYFPAVEEFTTAFADVTSWNFALVPGTPFRRAGEDGLALGADLTRLSSLTSLTTETDSAGRDSAPEWGAWLTSALRR